MKTRTPLLLVAASLALCACGEPTLDEAKFGLQADYDAKKFAEVVAAAPGLLERAEAEGASAGTTWSIEKLRVSALARQGEGDQTLKHLERLSGEYGERVDAILYNQLGGFVKEAGNYVEAINVLDAGKKEYPDKAAAFEQQIEDLTARAGEAGDQEALEALKALGYL